MRANKGIVNEILDGAIYSQSTSATARSAKGNR
jgi:hypothetical protein